MDLIIYVIIAAFVLFGGYFSGSEAAVISVNKFKLRSMKLSDKNQKK